MGLKKKDQLMVADDLFDGGLSTFRTAIAQLDAAAEEYDSVQEKADFEAGVQMARANEAQVQGAEARRVADRLRELVGV